MTDGRSPLEKSLVSKFRTQKHDQWQRAHPEDTAIKYGAIVEHDAETTTSWFGDTT